MLFRLAVLNPALADMSSPEKDSSVCRNAGCADHDMEVATSLRAQLLQIGRHTVLYDFKC